MYLVIVPLCAYCEQWGNSGNSNVPTQSTITLFKPYSTDTYSLSVSFANTKITTGGYNIGYINQTESSFTTIGHSSGSNVDNNFSWKTCGYLSN